MRIASWDRRGARGTMACGVVLAAVAATLALPGATAAQGTPESFLAEVSGHFDGSASKFVALAEAMPASTYGWSPSEGVATVASVYMHIARYNYMYLHENMGRDAPVTPAEYRRWEEGVTDKAEAVEILRASIEYVRKVLGEMDASDVGTETTLYGRQVDEGAVLFQLVAHMNEHLGQSIAYARMNGVVPPWSM